ncbi:hypothetical protein [Sphingomonas colocasiae]|uniref:Uncharacterized protein n=1 Tax=Sphingomonas colocasiae TaxID=1848973 RepID=A0ABS7PXZ5_9SPHN|nr:hypothetical protein [Sphingomonas colocasiae]MBY8826083.1 hypothetical protein [Sphingomonas colocasiae]
MTDAPHFAHDWDLIAAEAADAARRRKASIEILTERLGEIAAQAELAAWRAIAADWHWVVNHQRPAGIDDVSQLAKLTALEESYTRCTQQLRKAQDDLPVEIRATIDGNTETGLRYIHGDLIEPYLTAWRRRELVEAMLWWQRRTGDQSIRILVLANIKARQDRAPAIQGEAA